MEFRSSVCIVLVVLLVLVSSGLSATNLVNSLRPASADVAKKSNSCAHLNSSLTVIIPVIESWMSSKFFDLQPHPVQSFVFLVKEVYYVVQTLGKRLHELLFKPRNFFSIALPYIVALALIVMSFTPGFILPSKVIAFLLSILRICSDYWAPFDKHYLSQL
jgi:hypothetical protein